MVELIREPVNMAIIELLFSIVIFHMSSIAFCLIANNKLITFRFFFIVPVPCKSTYLIFTQAFFFLFHVFPRLCSITLDIATIMVKKIAFLTATTLNYHTVPNSEHL